MHKEKIAEKNGFSVYLAQDENAFNPRTDYDNAGTMVCWHKRYNLGDKHNFRTPDDFMEWWKENGKNGVLLPLALLDHSGLSMWVGRGPSPFDPGGWDSGQVGWIYLTRETIKKEWGEKKTKLVEDGKTVRYSPAAMGEKCLRCEVETYDQYLTGEVYGYILKDNATGDVVDSCWGFFGYEYAKEEANRVLEFHAKERDEEEKTYLDFIEAHS